MTGNCRDIKKSLTDEPDLNKPVLDYSFKVEIKLPTYLHLNSDLTRVDLSIDFFFIKN